MREAYDPNSRLFPALLLALAVHAAMIYGVRFERPDPPVISRSLEVVLAPKPADARLAEPSSVHGPQAPAAMGTPAVSGAAPEAPDALASIPVVGAARAELEPKHPPARRAPRRAEADRPSEGSATPAPREHRTRRGPASEPWATDSPDEPAPSSRVDVAVPEPAPDTGSATQDGLSLGSNEEAPAPAQPVRLTAATLDRQISEWTADYTRSQPLEPPQPARMAYVAKVAHHRPMADAYERAWQDKVERVGNLNYPEEARRKNLTGGLLLSVGVNADGSIHSVQVRKSSGHEELDQAAVRIVQLAAPFAPFPPELKNDYDVLVITRTWRFTVDSHLATTP